MKTVNTTPGAWICTNENDRQTRGRTKTHQPGSKIYLKDGEEFELELYNPTTNNLKAVIKIDGKPIVDGGLVLRCGQRVYLECFPDSKKKFTFKTYEVENTNESISAIANNGKVSISYYRENIFNNYNYNNYRQYDPYYDINTYVYGTNLEPNTNFNMNLNTRSTDNTTSITGQDCSIETGQVDGGKDSNQNFGTINMDFEYATIKTYDFQILPISQKPLSPKEFKVTKKKKTGSKADELLKLKELLDSELLSKEEFDKMKAEIID